MTLCRDSCVHPAGDVIADVQDSRERVALSVGSRRKTCAQRKFLSHQAIRLTIAFYQPYCNEPQCEYQGIWP